MGRIRARRLFKTIRLQLHARTTVVTVFLLLTFFSTSCLSEGEEVKVGEWSTFTSTEDNVAIDHPANWRVYRGEEVRGSDDTLVVDFVNLEGLRGGSVSIFHKQMGKPTLEEVAAWGEARLTETRESYELDELEATQVGKNSIPALTRRIRVDTDTVIPQRLEHVYVASDYGAFIVSFKVRESQFDDFTAVFDQMIASFRIVEETD